MSKSKLTLIIDGNWLLMSRLPVIHSRYIDEKTMMKEVKLLMIKSINNVLRTFTDIDNIIFVSDGGSWRQHIRVPQFIIDRKKGDVAVYKGNRERTDDIDWDLVFSEFNNFTNELKDTGISVFNEAGIEGDDWCWYWSTKLNNSGTNVIIWTTDRDITQLCSSNANGNFTVVWNKKKGVYVKDATETDLTSFLLNPYYHTNESILRNIMNSSIQTNVINPDAIRIDKIIRGDAGDNVLPIMTRSSKNGNIKYKVTEKQLPAVLDIYSSNDISSWVNETLSSKQWAGKCNEQYNEIIEHFDYNRQMVVLAEPSYPEYILNIFHKYDNWFDDHSICTDINRAEATILAERENLTNILDEI